MTETRPVPAGKNLLTPANVKRRRLWICLLLLMPLGLWWQRGLLLQWGLNRLLQYTPLTQTRFLGLQLDLTQARLQQMHFNLQTANGPVTAQLEGINLAYALQPLKLQTLTIDQASFHVNYQPQAKPEDAESSAATAALPLPQLLIDKLTLEVDTPWGVSQISGRFQLDAEPGQPMLLTFADAAQSITLQLDADFSHAKLAIVRAAAAPILDLQMVRQTPHDLQINLHADASAVWQWLTSTELIPQPLRTAIQHNTFMQANPNIVGMHCLLTATSADNLQSLQGRLLLTRQQAYLASADVILKPAKAQWQLDAHLDLLAAEFISLLKPWLPEAMNGWQFPAGNVMGTVRLNSQLKSPVSGEIYLKAHRLAAIAGPAKITDGYLRLDVRHFSPLIMAMEMDLPTLQLGEKTLLKQLQLKAELNNRILLVERATLPAFGGLLEVLPDKIDISQQPIMLTLGVHDLDLEPLLLSLNYPPLSGTGRLNGKLPLSLSKDSVEVRDGELTATQPGVLRYQAPGATNDNLALKALSNMRYHSLQAKLNYQPSGDYQVGLRLEGKNPQVLSGHPVAFNLNLTGSLPELIQKGIMAGDIDKPILEQIKHAQH